MCFAAAALTAVCLPGCDLRQPAVIESGHYELLPKYKDLGHLTATLSIDRPARSVIYKISGGPSTTYSWTPLPEEKWGAGCPTDVDHTVLEIVELHPPSLTLGPRSLKAPILVAECSTGPAMVTLTTTEERDRTGCGILGDCLIFREPGY